MRRLPTFVRGALTVQRSCCPDQQHPADPQLCLSGCCNYLFSAEARSSTLSAMPEALQIAPTDCNQAIIASCLSKSFGEGGIGVRKALRTEPFDIFRG